MRSKVLFKMICPPFLLLSFFLSLGISAPNGYCGELNDNPALDEKVRAFLEDRRGTWHDWNIPYSEDRGGMSDKIIFTSIL